MISQSKYKNKKVTFNGITFDSQKEYFRYKVLLQLEKQGKIKSLKLQVPFELIPSQYVTINNKKKCIERSCVYYADFTYIDCEKNEYVVEDTKGNRTEAYKIKKKLMLYVYGLTILET